MIGLLLSGMLVKLWKCSLLSVLVPIFFPVKNHDRSSHTKTEQTVFKRTAIANILRWVLSTCGDSHEMNLELNLPEESCWTQKKKERASYSDGMGVSTKIYLIIIVVVLALLSNGEVVDLHLHPCAQCITRCWAYLWWCRKIGFFLTGSSIVGKGSRYSICRIMRVVS